MAVDPVESRGRLAAQANQLVRRIKEDPHSYLTDHENELLSVILKIFKTLPGIPVENPSA